MYKQVCMRVYVCVCVRVLRSVPLCFASVQKGLVPTTWCRAASAPPIPAWIATLAANQKLPAAFAVCPLSIFSNTSLNLLASLGCCIKTPPSHPQSITLPNYKFLMSALRELFSNTPSHVCAWTHLSTHGFSPVKVASACQRATAVVLHRRGWKHDLMYLEWSHTHLVLLHTADQLCTHFHTQAYCSLHIMHKCSLCLLIDGFTPFVRTCE